MVEWGGGGVCRWRRETHEHPFTSFPLLASANTQKYLTTLHKHHPTTVPSQGLTQDAADYETKAAHVELAKKMKKRDPATAPAMGDRVPYVIIKAARGAKAYEKAEDPLYVLRNNLPIDSQHYLDHYLAQPLMRLFEPILRNPRDLLCGAHTRAILVSTPSSGSGGIMRFAQKKVTCLGCKAALGPGEKTVCKHCQPKVCV